jgi:hypothetical protein
VIYAPRDWRNDRVTLFHGTDSASASLILQGIDLGRCRPGGDFGRGFYTTTVRRQAEYWAIKKATPLGPLVSPAVIAFEVDLESLARLETLTFVRGDFESEDFWSLVFRCRGYLLDHGRSSNGGWYDLVVGPVSSFSEQRAAVPAYDQFSFHTQQGASLLDQSHPHVVT